jgi:predicted acylesterase/phospholipase RssA
MATESASPPSKVWSGEDWKTEASRTAVLLSGGAPTMHFIAGAMSAFYEHQVKFDVIAASGAGALPGLLYAAPKSGNPLKALRNTIDMNVEDVIYDHLPMNFKVFQKNSPLAKAMWSLTRNVQPPGFLDDAHKPESLARLYTDSVKLLGALATPTTLNWFSKSMCTRIESFLDDVVDWDQLACYPGEYCLNAFNLDEDRLEILGKDDIDGASFFAALAMCWLYPPTEFRGQNYTEGASHDPSAIEALWNNPLTEGFFQLGNADHIERIVAVETVVPDMWRDPRGLYDALALTIMDPLVALSEQMLSLYGRLEYEMNRAYESGRGGRKMPKLYVVPFTLPSWAEARAMDWNRSNGLMLWDTGEESARTFCRALGCQPPAGDDGPYNPFETVEEVDLESFRHHKRFRSDEGRKRRGNFMSMFDELFELATGPEGA